MALRGIRPTVEELRAVDSDPSRIPQIVDGYLDTVQFGDTVRELHNEQLLVRVQRPELTPAPVGALAGASFDDISRSYFDEPLRLIEDVVMTDQPYTQIVTADYTMADPIVAAIYGMPASSGGWQRAQWPDGRPAAGILVSDAVMTRYRSAAFNYQRGRANAIARALLCHDFLDGDVVIDPTVNLADPAIVANAVVRDPSCAACHQTLDPLASYFFPFEQGTLNLNGLQAYPTTLFDARQTAGWFLTNDRPPSYFGQDVAGLDGLGRAIAADPRFARCAATHFASYLTQTDAADLPADWIDELQAGFVRTRFNAKQLARAIVLSDRFRTAADEDPAAAEGVVGYQKVRPAQLARMLEDLTGFRWRGDSREPYSNEWRRGSIDYLDDDLDGYRVLAGGIDSFFVTQPVHTMNATASLVVREAAYRAASFVVAHDAAEPPGSRTLFTAAAVDANDEPSVRAELAVLHARIFGELETDYDASFELWQRAYAASGGNARRAWIVTLTGMLSDVRAVYY